MDGGDLLVGLVGAIGGQTAATQVETGTVHHGVGEAGHLVHHQISRHIDEESTIQATMASFRMFHWCSSSSSSHDVAEVMNYEHPRQ